MSNLATAAPENVSTHELLVEALGNIFDVQELREFLESSEGASAKSAITHRAELIHRSTKPDVALAGMLNYFIYFWAKDNNKTEEEAEEYKGRFYLGMDSAVSFDVKNDWEGYKKRVVVLM